MVYLGFDDGCTQLCGSAVSSGGVGGGSFGGAGGASSSAAAGGEGGGQASFDNQLLGRVCRAIG